LKGLKKLVEVPVSADCVTTGRPFAETINTPYGSSLARMVKLAVNLSEDPSTP